MMSPAAHMFDSDVRRYSSTRIPRSVFRGIESARSSILREPTEITTLSIVSRLLPSVTSSSSSCCCSMDCTEQSTSTVMPLDSRLAPQCGRGGLVKLHGLQGGAVVPMMVTFKPASVARRAASTPRIPPPIMASSCAGCSLASGCGWHFPGSRAESRDPAVWK